MFNNYQSEKALKRWAKCIRYFAMIFMALATLGAIIVLAVDVSYLWWIALLVFVGGLAISFPALFASHLVWGFAEIVENVKKNANGAGAPASATDESLPEL